VYQRQGSRIRQKIRIDVKPVLPRSERLHMFHSTYTARCVSKAGDSLRTCSGGGIIWTRAVFSSHVSHIIAWNWLNVLMKLSKYCHWKRRSDSVVLATIEGEIVGKRFPGRRRTAWIDDVRRWTSDDMNVARTNAVERRYDCWYLRVVRPTAYEQQQQQQQHLPTIGRGKNKNILTDVNYSKITKHISKN